MHIRSFIAIAISEQIRDAAERLLKELKAAGGSGVRWVDPTAMHITLSFLGNIDENSIVPLVQIMRDAARGIHPFPLVFSGVDAFPSLARARTIIVRVQDETESLRTLHRRLRDRLAENGFRVENRAFVPHLTLGRVKGRAKGGALIDTLKTRAGALLGTCEAREVFLMRSDLTPRGAKYTPMGSAKF